MTALKQNGFSLIELSIVLFISALLLRAAIVPLPQLRDTAMRKQASLQLRQVKQALIGHVIQVGALPCPVSLIELTHDVAGCQIAEGGVPAATLGLLGSVNEAGAVLDPWGGPLRYALSQADHQSRGSAGLPDWSTSGEIAAIGLREVQADIRLCRQPPIQGEQRGAAPERMRRRCEHGLVEHVLPVTGELAAGQHLRLEGGLAAA